MSQYDDTNKGVLFKNKKPRDEKSPLYTGSINVGGVDYWLNCWVRQSKAGESFMSLTCKPKVDGAERPITDNRPMADVIGEDLPF